MSAENVKREVTQIAIPALLDARTGILRPFFSFMDFPRCEWRQSSKRKRRGAMMGIFIDVVVLGSALVWVCWRHRQWHEALLEELQRRAVEARKLEERVERLEFRTRLP